MKYPEWKAVYIDKTKTLEEWRKAKDAEYKTQHDARLFEKLEETRKEVGLKGQILYPPPQFDLSKFIFDTEHAQGGRHPHNIKETEARLFIKDAYFAIYAIKAESYNYYGKYGGAFVQPNRKKIRTAFKSDEYNIKIQKLIEVFENEITET